MSSTGLPKPWTWSNGPELLCGDRIYSDRGLALPSGETLDWFLIVLSEAQMNSKAKGSRTEHKARRILESAGYTVLKAGGSLGLFDLVALGPSDVKCVQVKANGYVSAVEREQLALVVVPANVSKEIWRFKDRVKDPLIERL